MSRVAEVTGNVAAKVFGPTLWVRIANRRVEKGAEIAKTFDSNFTGLENLQGLEGKSVLLIINHVKPNNRRNGKKQWVGDMFAVARQFEETTGRQTVFAAQFTKPSDHTIPTKNAEEAGQNTITSAPKTSMRFIRREWRSFYDPIRKTAFGRSPYLLPVDVRHTIDRNLAPRTAAALANEGTVLFPLTKWEDESQSFTNGMHTKGILMALRDNPMEDTVIIPAYVVEGGESFEPNHTVIGAFGPQITIDQEALTRALKNKKEQAILVERIENAAKATQQEARQYRDRLQKELIEATPIAS